MVTVLFTILAASLDGFACGFVIGAKRIQLTMKNLVLISLFPFMLAIFSMTLSHELLPFMSEETSRFLGISLYFVLAIYSFISTRKNKEHETWMDPNDDLKITGMEIVSVGFALSMDTLIVAMPLSFLGYSTLLCATLFAVCNAILIGAGNVVAKHLPMKYCKDVSQMSWIFFLCLGIRRLF